MINSKLANLEMSSYVQKICTTPLIMALPFIELCDFHLGVNEKPFNWVIKSLLNARK